MASGPVGLWVDWAGDGFATGAYDDCTQLVTHASYSRGSSPEITGAAQAGQAVFTVKNPNALFNPDNAAGPLYGLLRDGAPVWWGMREDGTISGSSTATVRGRFAGRVVEVVPLPVPGAGSSTPLAQIICEDPLALYGRIPVKLSDDCSPPIAPSVEQYYTASYDLGGCLTSSWPQDPAASGNLLIAFLAQRGNPGHGNITLIGTTAAPGTCNAVADVPGTDWTDITGFDIATGGGWPNGDGGPITMAYRMSTLTEPQHTAWNTVSASEHSRTHHIEIAGLSGAPTVTATSHDQSTAGSVFTSPSITVPAAGFIFAGFSYSASGPSDGASAAFTMTARTPAVDLTRGYGGDPAFSSYFWPYSWFGYQIVSGGGTYTITLDRSAAPRNPTSPYGWIMGFWPS